MFSTTKAAGALASTDPYFYDVTLLLSGDGTNGGQNNTFLDSSSNNFTITRNGNTTQGSFSPYGNNWSNYFDGNADYFTVPTSVLTASGDFTIECWINASTSSSNTFVLSQFTTGSSGRTGFGLNGNVVEMLLGGTTYGGTTNIPYGSWTHLAFTRSGTTFKAYVNGTLDLTVTSSVSINQVNTNIGGDPAYTPALDFTGYISNLRVTNTVVYTGNFTPSTTPLTAISGTQLLTCQSNRFKDNSANNFALTVTGTPSVQRFSPFNPTSAYSTSVIGGSGYFDGSGDYLSAPPNQSFDFGNGNSTVECWVYLTRQTNTVTQGIISKGSVSSTGSDVWSIEVNSTGYLRGIYGNGGVALITDASLFPLNTWVHVAMVCSSSTITLYKNGASVGSSAASASISSGGGLYIGTQWYDTPASARQFQGYINDVRIVKGTAVYTSAFTPPTAPLTAITNTSLLCNMTNGAIYDSSMMNDLETVGNAQISTSVKKYGTGSMYFDGTGDYLSCVNTPNFAFGTGNFTIEFWINFSSISGYQTIYSYGYITAGDLVLQTDNGNGRLIIWVSGSAVITESGTASTGTWIHYALVRNGTTMTLYRNGTSSGSATNSTDINTTELIGIGAIPQSYTGNPPGALAVNGYIDDFRITKGYARYTSNFTPPTAALPNY